MAKHKPGKKLSKGQRKSCHKLAAQPHKAHVGNDNNAVKEAFLSAEFSDSVRFSAMGAAIIKAVQAPIRRTVEQARGWSAKLSFRTFKQLQEQGIMP